MGLGIAGELTGTVLENFPSRMESLERFAGRYPDGKVLVPSNPMMRSYGSNPYRGYDGTSWPFLYRGDYDGPVPPLARCKVKAAEIYSLPNEKRRT